MKCIAKIIFWAVLINSICAQDYTTRIRPIRLNSKQIPEQTLEKRSDLTKEIDGTQLSIVGGVSALSMTALNAYLNNTYWKDRRSGFYSKDEFNKYAIIDKCGYFYLSNIMTHILSASLESANMDFEETYIYGALGAFALGAYLEIRDGYSEGKSFSTTDLASTTLGSAYALSQYYIPILKEVQPRLSYFPTARLREGRASATENIFNDFGGQKYWLAFRMENLLPAEFSEYWPDFLMISLGVGVNNFNCPNPGKDLYIALDIDAEEIPLYGPIWQFIKNTLNYIHFPLPGIRLTNGIAVFGFCY